MTYLKTIHYKIGQGIKLTGSEELTVWLIMFAFVAIVSWGCLRIVEAWKCTGHIKGIVEDNDLHADKLRNGR